MVHGRSEEERLQNSNQSSHTTVPAALHEHHNDTRLHNAITMTPNTQSSVELCRLPR